MPEPSPAPSALPMRIGVLVRFDDEKEPGWAEVECDQERLWARISTAHHNSLGGMMLFPEIGSEVLLGMAGEVAVLLGALRPAHPMPAPDAPYLPEPGTQSLTSSSGCRVLINEQIKAIEASTPAGNKLVLSDEGKAVRISDQNGNAVLLDEHGVSIVSCKDLLLKSAGSIRLEAAQDIVLKAAQDISIKSVNIALTADLEFRATGNMTASITSSMQTAIKGAMVLIN